MQLFKKSNAHISTILLQDQNKEHVYITIDTWVSYDKYLQFKDEYGDLLYHLERECENYITDVDLIIHSIQL